MEVRASIKLQNDFTSYFQRNIMREITAKLNRNATQIQASIETQVKVLLETYYLVLLRCRN